MNWLIRISQAYSPEEIIEGVANNSFDINWASNEMRKIGPVACEAINIAASRDASAPAKMKLLAHAAGCPWNPILPGQMSDSHNYLNIPQSKQEKPDIPSIEV